MNERIAALDLLRGVAAFAVAIPHFLLVYDRYDVVSEVIAVLAVEVFFVLSGYVLAPQILFVLEQPRQLWIFLSRRWMRTVPVFLVAGALACLATPNVAKTDLFRTTTYVQNLWAQHNRTDFFSISWSLSIEEWFYIVFPTFLIGALAFIPKVRPAFLAIAFILLVSIIRMMFGPDAHWGGGVRRVVVFRLDAIAWGFLLYLYRPGLDARWQVPALFAVVIVSVLALMNIESEWARELYPFAVASLGMLLIVLFIGFEKNLRISAFRSFAHWTGRMSYSVYLFHLIAILMVNVLLRDLAVELRLFVFVLLTGAIAISRGLLC